MKTNISIHGTDFYINGEPHYAYLSGYQTPPVNWGINTDLKVLFFDRVRVITGSESSDS